jgi:hypothetical protein
LLGWFDADAAFGWLPDAACFCTRPGLKPAFMTDRIPSVTEQGIKVTFLKANLRSYNSGTADGIRFCSRAWLPSENRARLVWQRRIEDRLELEEIIDTQGAGSFEDGRIFDFWNRTFIAYTEGIYVRKPFQSIQRLAVLGPDFQPAEKITIKYGNNGNGKSEKNWQFFEWNGRLHFVYSINPHVVVALDGRKNFAVAEDFVTGGPIHWPWGDVLRGGTPPIAYRHPEFGDCFLSFFHTHALHRERNRRYAMGGYLFRDRPPFAIVALSEAILIASENDPTFPNPSVPDWHPLVVFPCGVFPNLVPTGRIVHVSLGVNDSMDAIAEIDPLKLRWHPVDYYGQPKIRYFRAGNGPLPILLKGALTHWKLVKMPVVSSGRPGYLALSDPGLIDAALRRTDVKEIDEEQFLKYEKLK